MSQNNWRLLSIEAHLRDTLHLLNSARQCLRCDATESAGREAALALLTVREALRISLDQPPGGGERR